MTSLQAVTMEIALMFFVAALRLKEAPSRMKASGVTQPDMPAATVSRESGRSMPEKLTSSPANAPQISLFFATLSAMCLPSIWLVLPAAASFCICAFWPQTSSTSTENTLYTGTQTAMASATSTVLPTPNRLSATGMPKMTALLRNPPCTIEPTRAGSFSIWLKMK